MGAQILRCAQDDKTGFGRESSSSSLDITGLRRWSRDDKIGFGR
jgi:hypothetical protein